MPIIVFKVEDRVPYCVYPASTGYFVANKDGNKWKKSPLSVKNPYSEDEQVLDFEKTQIGAGVRLVIGTSDR